MNAEKQLTEVADYFKSKVLSGEFEFISADSYSAKILIDKKFEIELWISNDPKYSFRLYNTFKEDLSPDLDLNEFKTQKDRLKAFKNVEKHLKTAQKASKLVELKKLQEELKKL